MMKTARHPAVLGQAEEFAVLNGRQAHRLSTVVTSTAELEGPCGLGCECTLSRDNRGGGWD